MKTPGKTAQLQIRVSAQQKARIACEAQQAGMSLSGWILSRLLSSDQSRFQQLLKALATAKQPGFVLAELNEFLTALGKAPLAAVLQATPELPTDAYRVNYLAAMVEQACLLKVLPLPAWLRTIKPLPKAHFISDLKSIRFHLLRHSPPAFRNRNIFIDSSLGARV